MSKSEHLPTKAMAKARSSAFVVWRLPGLFGLKADSTMLTLVLLFFFAALPLAQSTSGGSAGVDNPADKPAEAPLVPHGAAQWLTTFGSDHLRIWSSPFRLRREDFGEAVKVAGITAALISVDSPLSRVSTTQQSGRVTSLSNALGSATSWAGSLTFVGGFCLTGMIRHDSWQVETATLAFNAALHTSLVTSAIKSLSGRERPLLENHRGRFGRVGTFDSRYNSFPSGHTSAAWAIASVVALRYPSNWIRWTSYSSAALISVARVTGKKHFYADVFLGAYLGHKIGHWVVRRSRPAGPHN